MRRAERRGDGAVEELWRIQTRVEQRLLLDDDGEMGEKWRAITLDAGEAW